MKEYDKHFFPIGKLYGTHFLSTGCLRNIKGK